MTKTSEACQEPITAPLPIRKGAYTRKMRYGSWGAWLVSIAGRSTQSW
jgi:hypothetical protein